jgi:beta-glucosidase
MKKLCFFSAVLAGFFMLGSAASDLNSRRDARIKELLSQMTLEEKVGQMTQVTIEVVSQGSDGLAEPHALDRAKLEDAIITHHVGSILNVGSSGYSLQHWHDVITAIQDMAFRRTRLKVPVLYGIDAIHGATYTSGATLFPQAISMAATWNVDLMKNSGVITAREIRASGIPWNFYPVLDVGRQPLWPRFWETFGEDTYLAAQLGKSYVEGLQGSDYGAPDKAASCPKHYVGYSDPANGLDRTPATMSERTLREFYLPTFAAAVKAGSPTVMINSSEIDGIPGHANHHLISEVLKGEMRFEGFVVSDWEDIKRLHTRDRVAESPKAAVVLAVNAGIDMSMVPLDFSFYDLLLECAHEGLVSQARIDDAVTRILKVKAKLGLFEPGGAYPNPALQRMFATPEHAAANLAAAREAIILLKNAGNTLPLAKTSKVFVTGPTSALLSVMNGGWTITWQGDEERLYPKDKPTVVAAIREKIGAANVSWLQGATWTDAVDITAAVAEAKKADVTIVCLGEKAYCETPGNITDLRLDAVQIDLAQELIRTGKPVVVVLLEGRPRVIAPIVDGAAAIVLGFLPGMEGGRAIADVLFGDVNPSGKLPCSYPKTPNGFTTYDHKPLEETDGNSFAPQFPFGSGLSYTTFAYSDLRLGKEEITKDEQQAVSVKVKNTGAVAGKEVVQLYLQDEYGSVSRPVRQIRGFQKIELAPGEEKEVSFTLTPEDLSFIGLQNVRIVEPGSFKVMIDKFEKKFLLK